MWKVLVCVCALAAGGRRAALGQPPGTPEWPENDSAVVPIELTVPTPPTAFKADGRWNLVYELRVSSVADTDDVTLSKIQVLDPKQKVLVEISGDALRASVNPDAAVGLKLGPRTFTTIYMWVSASSLEELPPVLEHRVTLRLSNEPGEVSTDTPPVPVDRKPVLVIQPPLRGEDWIAANGPSNTSAHRTSILPVHGRSWIGQRFAIDWAQTFPDGNWYRGDKRVNKNYRSYGQPVYAVADGTIIEAKDGIPENTPDPTLRAVDITFATVAGNHVIEKITKGAYATFAHLQTGSVGVKAGDWVHSGQLLGLVGNTGNSTAPHLHFQICDSDSVLVCEGIPYAISSFEVEGHWKPGEGVVKRTAELPTEGEVVRFGTAP